MENDALFELVRKSGATEDKPITLGGVQFWLDGQWADNLCYSLPTSKWNSRAIAKDVIEGLATLAIRHKYQENSNA